MKQIWIKGTVFFFFTFLFFAVVSAQNVSQIQKSTLSSEDIATKETEMMKQKLSLTSDQMTRVKQINLDYVTRMKKASSADEKQRLESEQDAELKKVLNADQYSQWESNKKTWVDDLKKTWEKVKDGTKEGVDKVKEGTKDGVDKVKDGVDDLTK